MKYHTATRIYTVAYRNHSAKLKKMAIKAAIFSDIRLQYLQKISILKSLTDNFKEALNSTVRRIRRKMIRKKLKNSKWYGIKSKFCEMVLGRFVCL